MKIVVNLNNHFETTCVLQMSIEYLAVSMITSTIKLAVSRKLTKARPSIERFALAINQSGSNHSSSRIQASCPVCTFSLVIFFTVVFMEIQFINRLFTEID